MTIARAHILLVDDKQTMLSLVAKILSEHDVTTASTGEEALAVIAQRQFDLVLTDVRMPGADCFAVVLAVKQRWPTTEVIMMTAFASVESAVEAIKLGAYDYLQKPFDPDDVSLVVARALERRRVAVANGDPSAHPGSEAVADLVASEDEAVEANQLASLSYKAAVNLARDRISRDYLVALLRTFRGNVTQAAERAGLERESLHRLLRRYGLRAEAYRDG